jgi:hypothetical protein
MPEFILDHGSPEAARTYSQLDWFTQGYIEAMFFTDASSADDGDLENATVAEIAPEFLASIVATCQCFQKEAAALLDQAYNEHDYDESQAGRDYWFTRNGHGVGFWDRDLGELGEALSAACRYSSVDIYRGDDGQIYG